MGKLTKSKAKKILRDKKIRGRSLTAKQKRFFGLMAGGGRSTRVKSGKKVRRSTRKRR